MFVTDVTKIIQQAENCACYWREPTERDTRISNITTG